MQFSGQQWTKLALWGQFNKALTWPFYIPFNAFLPPVLFKFSPFLVRDWLPHLPPFKSCHNLYMSPTDTIEGPAQTSPPQRDVPNLSLRWFQSTNQEELVWPTKWSPHTHISKGPDSRDVWRLSCTIHTKVYTPGERTGTSKFIYTMKHTQKWGTQPKRRWRGC